MGSLRSENAIQENNEIMQSLTKKQNVVFIKGLLGDLSIQRKLIRRYLYEGVGYVFVLEI